ncbi:hypothetical protein B296_00002536 [Ensete ventricosum]|uniref:Uncharacterized protein n=1 Tax=Ensete ventricosum TaxID=4639 RepID=A0A427A541_ENSVE|nr:hypothetical protein B296_00002536 [Ensete ventricosum]
MDFSELSISVLVLRWSKANQELSLELSPRRDSVIGLQRGQQRQGGGCGIVRSVGSSRQQRGGIEEGQRRCFGVITAIGKEEGTRVPRWQRRVRSRRRLQRLQRQSKVWLAEEEVAEGEGSSVCGCYGKKGGEEEQHGQGGTTACMGKMGKTAARPIVGSDRAAEFGEGYGRGERQRAGWW